MLKQGYRLEHIQNLIGICFTFQQRFREQEWITERATSSARSWVQTPPSAIFFGLVWSASIVQNPPKPQTAMDKWTLSLTCWVANCSFLEETRFNLAYNVGFTPVSFYFDVRNLRSYIVELHRGQRSNTLIGAPLDTIRYLSFNISRVKWEQPLH